MIRRWVLLAGAVAVLAVAGCGGGDAPPRTPPAAARQPVADFLAALQDGRFADACAQLPADVRKDLRDDALSGFRVHLGSAANRLRQVKTAGARAATCTGALSLIVAETGAAKLRLVARRARTQPLHWIGPPSAGEATIGADEDWDTRHDGDHWRIDTINALPPGP